MPDSRITHCSIFRLCGCLNLSYAFPLQQHQYTFALRAPLCLHMPRIRIAAPAGLLVCRQHIWPVLAGLCAVVATSPAPQRPGSTGPCWFCNLCLLACNWIRLVSKRDRSVLLLSLLLIPVHTLPLAKFQFLTAGLDPEGVA